MEETRIQKIGHNRASFFLLTLLLVQCLFSSIACQEASSGGVHWGVEVRNTTDQKCEVSMYRALDVKKSIDNTCYLAANSTSRCYMKTEGACVGEVRWSCPPWATETKKWNQGSWWPACYFVPIDVKPGDFTTY